MSVNATSPASIHLETQSNINSSSNFIKDISGLNIWKLILFRRKKEAQIVKVLY